MHLSIAKCCCVTLLEYYEKWYIILKAVFLPVPNNICIPLLILVKSLPIRLDPFMNMYV